MRIRDVTCAWWDPFTDKCQLLGGKKFDRFGCGDCTRNSRMDVDYDTQIWRIALCRNQPTTKIVERRIDCFGNEYYVEVER